MPSSATNRAAFARAVAGLVEVVRRLDREHRPVTDEVNRAEVGCAICATRFGGRGGSSEYKVITAAWRIAVEAKTSEPTLPLRRLTNEAGIGSRGTTAKALRRLIDAGWMEKVEHTDGRRGNRYRLGTPEQLTDAVRKPGPIAFKLGRPRDGDARGDRLGGDPLEDSWLIKHDAFAYKALGSSAARLYVGLSAGVRTRSELVELTGLSRDTVRRNLHRLADNGLAVDEGTHWRAVPFTAERLDSIAREFRTAGRHERQARKHERDRRRNVMRQLDVIVADVTDRRDWRFDEDGLLVNVATGEAPDVYGQVWPSRPAEPTPIAAWSPVVRDWWAKRRPG